VRNDTDISFGFEVSGFKLKTEGPETRNLRPETILPYSALFKDHLANPRNAGELADATAVAEETNPVCGDRLRLSLRVRGGRVEAARFLAYGHAAALAVETLRAALAAGEVTS
jgi:hypothetical protein